MAERALSYTERRGGTEMSGNGGGVRDALRADTWHPTVVNLLVLVVVEVALYAVMRYSFRSFHGG